MSQNTMSPLRLRVAANQFLKVNFSQLSIFPGYHLVVNVRVAKLRRTWRARPAWCRRGPVRRNPPDRVYMGEGSAAVPARAAVPTADLLARQTIRDGELILLIIKPSRWMVVLSSLRFVAGIVAVLCAIGLLNPPQAHLRYCIDGGLFAISFRIMWAVLNWMGRIYVLTDQRVLRLSGVLYPEVADCPLRKVASTALAGPFHERLLRLDTIEVRPLKEGNSSIYWQTVCRPREVREQIEAAVRKARDGGCTRPD